MATTIKTVKTLDIVVSDDGGYETTFKIDNPNENITITMSRLREIYAPIITNQYLMSKHEYPFTVVNRAAITEITTTTSDIG